MSDKLTPELLQELTRLHEAATPGPWRSLRDGNQFIETDYIPTAKVVGASRIEGPRRPWNPHALLAFGFKPEEYETVRLVDADADLVAAMRNAPPLLLTAASESASLRAEVERLRSQLGRAEGVLRPFAHAAGTLSSRDRDAFAEVPTDDLLAARSYFTAHPPADPRKPRNRICDHGLTVEDGCPKCDQPKPAPVQAAAEACPECPHPAHNEWPGCRVPVLSTTPTDPGPPDACGCKHVSEEK